MLVVASLSQSYYPSYGYSSSDPLASIQPIDDMLWRTVLALGAVPALLTLYWRLLLPETPRYTALVEGDPDLVAADMSTVLNTRFLASDAPHNVGVPLQVASPRALSSGPAGSSKGGSFSRRIPPPDTPPTRMQALWAYLRYRPRAMRWSNAVMLFGCCSTWFLVDVAFYSQSLFQKDVFTTIGWLPAANHMSAVEELFNVARAQALISLGSTIPGYWATVFTADYLGRWNIQAGGFFFMSMWLGILAAQYSDLVANQTGLFVTFYALTFFFCLFSLNHMALFPIILENLALPQSP